MNGIFCTHCVLQKEIDNSCSPRASTPVSGEGVIQHVVSIWEEVTSLMKKEKVVGKSFTEEVTFYK